MERSTASALPTIEAYFNLTDDFDDAQFPKVFHGFARSTACGTAS